MADVFEVLRKDHEEVESLLSQLTAGSPDTPELADRLVMEESRHEAVEEMYFWPSVKEKVEGGEGLAHVALSQEDSGKTLLERLRKTGAGPQFEELIATFAAAARAHVAYEQDEVWPRLEAVLSAEERRELGDKIERAKKAAPTRPHPHAPDSPGALKTVGTATAMVDRVADKMTGRGE